nr:MarR family transcriptional regulator [Fertoeibacter niger]
MPKPEALLCFNLYAASHAFNRAYKPLLDPLGLTYPQFLVMLSLGQQDGQAVGQLSDDLGIETNTLSPLLKRLEAAGQLRRERSQTDERRVFIHLTPAGIDTAFAAQRIPESMAAALGITRDEADSSLATLRRLRDLLNGTPRPQID